MEVDDRVVRLDIVIHDELELEVDHSDPSQLEPFCGLNHLAVQSQNFIVFGFLCQRSPLVGILEDHSLVAKVHGVLVEVELLFGEAVAGVLGFVFGCFGCWILASPDSGDVEHLAPDLVLGEINEIEVMIEFHLGSKPRMGLITQ